MSRKDWTGRDPVEEMCSGMGRERKGMGRERKGREGKGRAGRAGVLSEE